MLAKYDRPCCERYRPTDSFTPTTGATPEELDKRLVKAGVGHARGFSLNVSNYQWSVDENAYGRDISARLGGKALEPRQDLRV